MGGRRAAVKIGLSPIADRLLAQPLSVARRGSTRFRFRNWLCLRGRMPGGQPEPAGAPTDALAALVATACANRNAEWRQSPSAIAVRRRCHAALLGLVDAVAEGREAVIRVDLPGFEIVVREDALDQIGASSDKGGVDVDFCGHAPTLIVGPEHVG